MSARRGRKKQAPAEAVELLRRIVAIPSPSQSEGPVVDLLASELPGLGLDVERHGDNLLVVLERGSGPTLDLCTHVDTVPAVSGWSRDPHDPEIEGERLHGLGSNDAGAAIVSMIHAVAELAGKKGWQGRLRLALVVEEEVSGAGGAEALLQEVGLPDAAIVGEPTGLEICISQKGLVVLDAVNHGAACHAAHAWRLEHDNAVLGACRDAQAVHAISFAAQDPALGPTTLQVTGIRGGVAANVVPDRCAWIVDGRVNPAQTLEEVVEAVQAAVRAEVRPRSIRLHPLRTDPEAAVVRAALAARPEARTFGSDTLSDAVFYRTVPVVKAGPGLSERSHRPDEYVELSWLAEGIHFYRDAALAFFAA